MSRDMQIGLVLAVGFLALVGGVLYYRIEHPDELEQFLNGNQQAQATAPAGKEADTSKPDPSAGTGTALAANGGTPPAPPVNTPALEVPVFPNPNTGTTPPASSGTAVVQTGANPATTPPGVTMPPPPVASSGAPALDLTALDKKPAETKPVASAPAKEEKKPETPTTARTSLPVLDTPGTTAPPAPPPSTAPSIALDLTPKSTSPALDAKKPEEKKVDEKKPVDLTIKTDVAAGNAPPPAVTPPSMNPPSLNPSGSAGATLPITPPAATITMSDPKKDTPATPPEKKSEELPQPPVVSAPAAGSIALDTRGVTPPATGAPNLNLNVAPSSNPAANTTPVGNTSPLGNTAPALGNNTPPAPATSGPDLGKTPLDVTIRPAPLTNNSPSTAVQPDKPPVTDPDGFRNYPPKAGLGKPMPESEVALRERRWAETSGSPAPIVPSSLETRGSAVTAPVTGPGVRGVVRDTYMPKERALQGETFSSLSQRLYGDTNYAVALAAFNKEEGFVKLDQPTPGEWVAKPNREILDQKYPHLVRRLTPTNLNQSTMTMLTNNTRETAASGSAVPKVNANYPTYRVGKGEQLFEVAKKTLGDGYRWSEIYSLNKDLLQESTELRPDMVLKLPMEARK